jgi:hypothetical protein
MDGSRVNVAYVHIRTVITRIAFTQIPFLVPSSPTRNWERRPAFRSLSVSFIPQIHTRTAPGDHPWRPSAYQSVLLLHSPTTSHPRSQTTQRMASNGPPEPSLVPSYKPPTVEQSGSSSESSIPDRQFEKSNNICRSCTTTMMDR